VVIFVFVLFFLLPVEVLELARIWLASEVADHFDITYTNNLFMKIGGEINENWCHET